MGRAARRVVSDETGRQGIHRGRAADCAMFGNASRKMTFAAMYRCEWRRYLWSR
jgi:hypothetical protein